MSCIKTGCYVYLAPHDMWAYGDAFEMFGVYFFRICQVERKPIGDRRHFTINDWAIWFDENKTSMAQNSTMICDPFSVVSHGYDGVPL